VCIHGHQTPLLFLPFQKIQGPWQNFVSHWKIPQWASGGPAFSEGKSVCFYTSQGIPTVPKNKPNDLGSWGEETA